MEKKLKKYYYFGGILRHLEPHCGQCQGLKKLKNRMARKNGRKSPQVRMDKSRPQESAIPISRSARMNLLQEGQYF